MPDRITFGILLLAVSLHAADKPLTPPVQMDKLWGNPGVEQQDIPENQQWYQEAKFAMFIHWGLYSEAAGVWQGKNYFGIAEWIMNRAKIPVKEYEKQRFSLSTETLGSFGSTLRWEFPRSRFWSSGTWSKNCSPIV